MGTIATHLKRSRRLYNTMASQASVSIKDNAQVITVTSHF